MSYRIAGIDVHKKKLAVVLAFGFLADVEVEDEYQFEHLSDAGTPSSCNCWRNG